MINADLLAILCCPESQQELRAADGALVQNLNARIAKDLVKNRAGQLVKEAVDEGLIRSDKRFLYPIRRNLPVLLVDEAIPLAE
jgi:uncharacterized protein YbaR (Trm112 family)